MFPLQQADFDAFFGRFGHSIAETLAHLQRRGISVMHRLYFLSFPDLGDFWRAECTVTTSWCGGEFWQQATLDSDLSGEWTWEEMWLSVTEAACRELVGDEANSYEHGSSSLSQWYRS